MVNISVITCTKIHFAPLQSFTDRAYRTAFERFSQAVDWYYTPYIAMESDGSIRNLSDLGENSSLIANRTIPQILPANLTELKTLINAIQPYDYNTLNINAGCPYPMAINKGRGAALIHKPELVATFISYIKEFTPYNPSLKTRLGITNNETVFHVLEQIAKVGNYPVIIHARNAKQMYKGFASPEGFYECVKRFPNLPLIYNGDIFKLDDFSRLRSAMPNQGEWMLGRGTLMNPLLPLQLKNLENKSNKDEIPDLKYFCLQLIDEIEKSSRDSGHARNRISTQMIYLHNIFCNGNKMRKLILKMKSIEDIRRIIIDQPLLGQL